MTAVLTSLTVNTQYTLQFYWAIRAAKSVSDTTAGNSTQSLYSISYAGTPIYTSPANLASTGGWTMVSVPFTPTVASGNLIFNVTSLINQDHSILFDAIIVRSPAGPLVATISSGTLYGFEYPNLSVGSQVQYYYNPQQVAGFQPWLWSVGPTQGQGGVAAAGSPFDPPSPALPPQGNQYGFVQIAPGAGGLLTAWMSANVSGLTSGSNYYVSFSWGIRAQQVITDNTLGNVTTASFVVTIGGTTIYTSPVNLSDAGGWALVNSNTFTGPSGVVPLTFTVTALVNTDHTLLFDQVQVNAGSSPGGGPVSTPSSSTGNSGTTVVPVSVPSSSSSSAAGASGTSGVGYSSGSSGLSGGAIAGIVIGSVVGVAIICLVLVSLCASGRRGKKAAREDGTSEPSHNTAQWSQQQEEGEHHSNDVEMQETHE